MRNSETCDRKRLEITGIVQGVGFRPFIYGLAQQLGLAGYVRNHSSGVTIEIEGEPDRLEQFIDLLDGEIPPLAHIDSVEVMKVPLQGCRDFRIIESATIAAASTPISPDVATCQACLKELNDPADRRYRYPFINCTNCGPRYTIVQDIPYDRPLTTMSAFPMCEACQCEYDNPADRRYHAQPNACPDCGPAIWFVGGDQRKNRDAFDGATEFAGQYALEAFHQSIKAGEIVAAKGIGGFHLTCAAGDSAAIQKLRERKGRVDKPFAIMVADVAAAKLFADVGAEEEHILTSRQRPIVLLRKRAHSGLSELVAPGNDFVGIMLPYSPLHAMLVERISLVMTSGN